MVGAGLLRLAAEPALNAIVRRRCAIYTRKSSEEGLKLSFNSLDAQRESCAAYIKSQSHEGWELVPTSYDDGGYSGGTLKRPALQRLLDDVRERRVDVIVVYKIDRLTRSLADFAKIVEVLDCHGASFVSVTQQFNTTSSMGRLTLNVLLSFAQFEREVAGERVRDKILASKRRGMWMGGHAPLGYTRMNKQLVVHEEEADIVRYAFERYLDLESVSELQKDSTLKARLAKTERRNGKRTGKERYGRSALYNLLRNQAYIGRVPHKGTWYQGQHPPIVDRGVWDKVQKLLQAHRSERAPVNSTESPLSGLLFDAASNRMTPSFTKKRGGLCYRYYISQALLQNGRKAASMLMRVPAEVIEQTVAGAIEQHVASTAVGRVKNWHGGIKCPSLRDLLERVVVSREGVHIRLRNKTGLFVPGVFIRTGKGLSFQQHGQVSQHRSRKATLPLIKAVSRAHRWLQLVEAGAVRSYLELARRERMNPGYVRRLMQLAFLAPDLIDGIIHNRLTARQGVVELTASEIPLSWRKQRELFVPIAG
jgi:DNA invertase Pin-like site-specific DNA recombinase